MRKDVYHNIEIDQSLEAQTLTASANATGVDLQGFCGIDHVVNVGESGDTLSGTVYIELKLEESDELASGYAVVTADKDVHGTIDTSGVFATIDLAGEDQAIYEIGYRGNKRYSRVAVALTGTHTNGTPVGILGVKGIANHSKTKA